MQKIDTVNTAPRILEHVASYLSSLIISRHVNEPAFLIYSVILQSGIGNSVTQISPYANRNINTRKSFPISLM